MQDIQDAIHAAHKRAGDNMALEVLFTRGAVNDIMQTEDPCLLVSCWEGPDGAIQLEAAHVKSGLLGRWH